MYYRIIRTSLKYLDIAFSILTFCLFGFSTGMGMSSSDEKQALQSHIRVKHTYDSLINNSEINDGDANNSWIESFLPLEFQNINIMDQMDSHSYFERPATKIVTEEIIANLAMPPPESAVGRRRLDVGLTVTHIGSLEPKTESYEIRVRLFSITRISIPEISEEVKHILVKVLSRKTLSYRLNESEIEIITKKVCTRLRYYYISS